MCGNKSRHGLIEPVTQLRPLYYILPLCRHSLGELLKPQRSAFNYLLHSHMGDLLTKSALFFRILPQRPLLTVRQSRGSHENTPITLRDASHLEEHRSLLAMPFMEDIPKVLTDPPLGVLLLRHDYTSFSAEHNPDTRSTVFSQHLRMDAAPA